MEFRRKFVTQPTHMPRANRNPNFNIVVSHFIFIQSLQANASKLSFKLHTLY